MVNVIAASCIARPRQDQSREYSTLCCLRLRSCHLDTILHEYGMTDNSTLLCRCRAVGDAKRIERRTGSTDFPLHRTARSPFHRLGRSGRDRRIATTNHSGAPVSSCNSSRPTSSDAQRCHRGGQSSVSCLALGDIRIRATNRLQPAAEISFRRVVVALGNIAVVSKQTP